MELHEKISQVREAKKISRAEMATALNMSSQSYWNVETGKTELTVSRLTQIAEILGVSVLELLMGEKQKIAESEKVEKLRERIEELEKNNKILSIILTQEGLKSVSLGRSAFRILNDYMINFGLKNEFFNKLDYINLIEKPSLDTSHKAENDIDDLDLFDAVLVFTAKDSVTELMDENQIITAIKNLDDVSRQFINMFFEQGMIIDPNLENAYTKYLALSKI